MATADPFDPYAWPTLFEIKAPPKEDQMPPLADPTYAFTGTLSGENLMTCEGCGALVKESGTATHTAFHRSCQ